MTLRKLENYWHCVHFYTERAVKKAVVSKLQKQYYNNSTYNCEYSTRNLDIQSLHLPDAQYDSYKTQRVSLWKTSTEEGFGRTFARIL